jgi:hypothetical protein
MCHAKTTTVTKMITAVPAVVMTMTAAPRGVAVAISVVDFFALACFVAHVAVVEVVVTKISSRNYYTPRVEIHMDLEIKVDVAVVVVWEHFFPWFYS